MTIRVARFEWPKSTKIFPFLLLLLCVPSYVLYDLNPHRWWCCQIWIIQKHQMLIKFIKLCQPMLNLHITSLVWIHNQLLPDLNNQKVPKFTHFCHCLWTNQCVKSCLWMMMLPDCNNSKVPKFTRFCHCRVRSKLSRCPTVFPETLRARFFRRRRDLSHKTQLSRLRSSDWRPTVKVIKLFTALSFTPFHDILDRLSLASFSSLE